MVDLGRAAEAVGDEDGRPGAFDLVEAGFQSQSGHRHRGLVVLFLEAEVPGESAAALRLVDVPYAEAAQHVPRAAAGEGRVLVAVRLKHDLLRQWRRSPVFGGEAGQCGAERVDASGDAVSRGRAEQV